MEIRERRREREEESKEEIKVTHPGFSIDAADGVSRVLGHVWAF